MRLTIPEAAQRMGISPFTVRRYLKAGKLKGELVEKKHGGSQWFVILDDDMTELPDAVMTKALAVRVSKIEEQVGSLVMELQAQGYHLDMTRRDVLDMKIDRIESERLARTSRRSRFRNMLFPST